MEDNKNDTGGGGRLAGNESNPRQPLQTQEKSSEGGAYNSGVTSEDPVEKKDINKKATLLGKQPLSEKERQQQNQQAKEKHRGTE